MAVVATGFESLLVAEELEERVEFQVSGSVETSGGSNNGVEEAMVTISIPFKVIGEFIGSVIDEIASWFS